MPASPVTFSARRPIGPPPAPPPISVGVPSVRPPANLRSRDPMPRRRRPLARSVAVKDSQTWAMDFRRVGHSPTRPPEPARTDSPNRRDRRRSRKVRVRETSGRTSWGRTAARLGANRIGRTNRRSELYVAIGNARDFPAFISLSSFCDLGFTRADSAPGGSITGSYPAPKSTHRCPRCEASAMLRPRPRSVVVPEWRNSPNAN